LNFDFPEIKVKIGENGEVVEIGKRYSRLAEKMIEQAMLAANETVAEHYKKLQMPFVYRVHEGPGDEKLLNLNSALLAFDYPELGGEDGEVSPKEMQKLLALTEGRPEAELIQIMALRSMSHAAYSPDCTGHFGLAAKYYCHFTSPIRRYADLAVHRIIKRELNSNDDTAPRRLTRYVAAAAKQASDREKLAEEVEREAVKMKECLYMREHIGEEFAAKVSGMTAGGIYVALENGIEGRISVDDLPQDEYNYIAETMLMHGRKHSYTLGDELNVRLARVSMMERHMDFVLAE
jgi:ribonuclease R